MLRPFGGHVVLVSNSVLLEGRNLCNAPPFQVKGNNINNSQAGLSDGLSQP